MNRRRTLVCILTAVQLFSFAPSAFALYQWMDDKGDSPHNGRSAAVQTSSRKSPKRRAPR